MKQNILSLIFVIKTFLIAERKQAKKKNDLLLRDLLFSKYRCWKPEDLMAKFDWKMGSIKTFLDMIFKNFGTAVF